MIEELDKYEYIEKKMKGVNFVVLEDENFKHVEPIIEDLIIAEPMDLTEDFYTDSGLFMYRTTAPKLMGVVTASSVDGVNIGDKVVYNNDYKSYVYYINEDNESEWKIQIHKNNILLHGVK